MINLEPLQWVRLATQWGRMLCNQQIMVASEAACLPKSVRLEEREKRGARPLHRRVCGEPGSRLAICSCLLFSLPKLGTNPDMDQEIIGTVFWVDIEMMMKAVLILESGRFLTLDSRTLIVVFKKEKILAEFPGSRFNINLYLFGQF